MGFREKIDGYFLSEKCPYSQKRKIKGKQIGIFLGCLLAIGIVAILVTGGRAEKNEKAQAMTDAQTAERMKTQAGMNSGDGAGSVQIGGGSSGHGSQNYGFGGAGGGGSSRQYTASQLVKPGGDGVMGSSNGEKLPIGTTLGLKLLNRVISSDSASPVIAAVTEDIVWKGSVVIPEGTKAIGQAALDDTSHRLQVRFNTFVFPEGQEHPVSGLALLPDGSSGIPGDYRSGELKKQTGRFIGNFVGGLADGMKDRQAGGQLGIAFEPGSLKNGILNGFAESASDQAKLYSDDMQKDKPFLEVDSGANFLLYLDREF